MVGKIPRFRHRKRGKTTYYFYDHGGKPRKETPLGKDYGLAIKRWSDIENANAARSSSTVLFQHVADAYRREVIPNKAPRTQRDNLTELAKLLEFFNDPPAPFDAIKPGDVQDYMRWRKAAPVRATREKALLSHMWNWARSERYTDLPNPCAGIKGHATGRDAYIDDDTFLAIWNAGSDTLRDAMDLAYLTGQRPADVLCATEMDVHAGVLHFQQGKTGAKVRVEVTGALEAVLARISARKARQKVHCTRLVTNAHGQPIGVNAISRHWKAACEAAQVEGYQFRDLRAKAATDTEEASGSLRDAQRQLGHTSLRMTEHYARNRRGAKVKPTGTRKNAENAEKTSAPKGAWNMEAGVGIEPAYADLQSGAESSK